MGRLPELLRCSLACLLSHFSEQLGDQLLSPEEPWLTVPACGSASRPQADVGCHRRGSADQGSVMSCLRNCRLRVAGGRCVERRGLGQL